MVIAELSIVAALHVPFLQFAISCTFHSGKCNDLSILYLVRTLFHCVQYTARILWRSHSSSSSICPFMSAYRKWLIHPLTASLSFFSLSGLLHLFPLAVRLLSLSLNFSIDFGCTLNWHFTLFR